MGDEDDRNEADIIATFQIIEAHCGAKATTWSSTTATNNCTSHVAA